MSEVIDFIEKEVWQIRLRDGRTIYCDDDNRWFISGEGGYYMSLKTLLIANGLIVEETK